MRLRSAIECGGGKKMEREEIAKFIDNRITNYVKKINELADDHERYEEYEELQIKAAELANLFDKLGFRRGDGIVAGDKRHVIIDTRTHKAMIC